LPSNEQLSASSDFELKLVRNPFIPGIARSEAIRISVCVCSYPDGSGNGS
jgi:hypothetical protein